MTTKTISKIENYALIAVNGNKIRTATRVIFSDGSKVSFTEKMSKREATEQSKRYI